MKTGLTATSYTIAAAEILSEAGSPYTWRVRATDGTNTDGQRHVVVLRRHHAAVGVRADRAGGGRVRARQQLRVQLGRRHR